MKNLFLRLAILTVVFAWCLPTLGAEKKEIKPTVMEIESFKLTKAGVQNMKEASGGKVVVFDQEGSRAETTYKLPPGWYGAVLYVWAEDAESDSVHLMIEADDYNAGVAEQPVLCWDKKKIAPCNQMIFKVGDDRERKIVLRTDKKGIRLDRLVFQKPEW